MISLFWCACALREMHTIERVLPTFFGIAWHECLHFARRLSFVADTELIPKTMFFVNAAVVRCNKTDARTITTGLLPAPCAYLFVGAFRYLASASWRLLAVTLDMTNRRFPPPWTIERLPGGFKVIDADGQPLAYFYARENDNDAGTGGVLTMDEARRLASNFAKELP